jgi:hypothetical protein
MAQTGGFDLDENLACARPFEIEGFDLQRAALRIRARQALLEKNGASHLHFLVLLPDGRRTLADLVSSREARRRSAALHALRSVRFR